MIEFLEGKKLTVTVKARDRYGRFLIELFAQEPPLPSGRGSDAINVSDWLLRNGFAARRR